MSDVSPKTLRMAHDVFEWSTRVQLTGERFVEFAPIHFKTVLEENRDQPLTESSTKKIETVNRRLTAEIYFFAISFHNYLKSLDRLGVNLEVNRFKEIKRLTRALRNIWEHPENHILDENRWKETNYVPNSNFQTFLKRFPNLPDAPFNVTISMDGGMITIAKILEVNSVLRDIRKNDTLIRQFLN